MLAILEDWRRFFDPRFRIFHRIALFQGLMVLAGMDVVVPFALDIGCPPALTALLGALPICGGMAQLAVPRLLARTDGNLRLLTLAATALGGARALVYCMVAVGIVLGWLDSSLGLAMLALGVLLAGVMGTVSQANLLAWYSAVLPEQDRRLVTPRTTVLVMAVAALLLFPMGLGLDWLAERFGLAVYALLFGVSGLFAVGEVAHIRRLPLPGRVIVPPRAMGDAPETPAERQFLRVTALNALGMGLTPYLSVYAMSVLGLSAGFALTMSAVATLSMVVGAAVGGGMLARGSSGRLLRQSFAIRAVAVVLPILALPGSFAAPLLLYATASLAAIGFSAGQVAANERMFRLVRGPTVIRQHGRMLFRNAAAMTSGQVAGSVVLAAGGPLGYPAFALLFGASSAMRVLAYRAAAALPVMPPATMPALPAGDRVPPVAASAGG